MILLIKFILAHFIGDFLLQHSSWVQSKLKSKWKSPWLYVHILVHFVLIILITQGFQYWREALIISGVHLIIDIMKIHFQREATARAWFFIDQAMHIATILLVWYAFHFHDALTFYPGSQFWIYLTATVFLSTPSSFIVSYMIMPYTKQLDEPAESALPRAGQYIGILERILSLAFIAIGQWGALGFLIGAKSAFRFADLTRAKDRRLTEYILIGTLLSFSMAIGTGLICKWIISLS
jgi:hypothetical protein